MSEQDAYFNIPSVDQSALVREQNRRAHRRIGRIKSPDMRALAYFVHEMRYEEPRTIRAAVRYLNERFNR